ncbi:MAG: hypothetical protein EXS63_07190 [Candidatus Omnitrophica bacterium]|nr:hypothetical protein [Candidatus Omnitrophota bacterium]
MRQSSLGTTPEIASLRLAMTRAGSHGKSRVLAEMRQSLGTTTEIASLRLAMTRAGSHGKSRVLAETRQIPRHDPGDCFAVARNDARGLVMASSGL